MGQMYVVDLDPETVRAVVTTQGSQWRYAVVGHSTPQARDRQIGRTHTWEEAEEWATELRLTLVLS